ncbi:unnamed protein product [Brassica napus]|uniref:(rape) hypothetical protein n=1 Tax=Brassica napus TaxID=3708 RepID=A0A816YC09_BRANA|nr:unnamed protein product [Brassica napus]
MQSLIILLQYRERVIFNGQNIDEEFSNNILATMLYLDTLDDSRRIYMYLNGPGGDIFKDLSRLKRFNSEEAIEYGLIIVRPPCIKDDAPLQDESSGLG